MSKGTILSGGTGGQYSVAVALDDAAIAVRITVLESRLAALQVDITTADGDLEDLEDVYSALLDEQNALIDAFAADPIKDNLVAINEKTAEAAEAAAAVGTQRARLAALVADEASTRKEITRLSAAPATVTTSAWCADLTEDLAGDVGLIEVPGGERGQHLQIRPGHGGAAAYSAAMDGMLRQPFADVPAATTYNIAMLPGWQKWLPRYRLAEINSIDTEADTCTLTIAAATSGEQGIGVNHATAYSDVPIEYMNCNAQAFAVGDAVLVEFVAQTETGVEGNWAAGKLKVVGFASNPKACGTSTWLCWPSSDGAVFGWGDPYENPPGTPVNPPLGTVQTSYSDAAHIAREINQDTVTHGVNARAGVYSWRDETTPLVVSYDSTGIFSGGNVLFSSGPIMGVSVRWDGGTPYLLYVFGLNVFAQECVIVDDVVESLTGPLTRVYLGGFSNPFERQWDSSISPDGTKMVMTTKYQGGPVNLLYFNAAYTYDLPWPFSLQTVQPAIHAESDPFQYRYDAYNDYEYSQRFFLKSQYVGESLVDAWVTLTVHRSLPSGTHLYFLHAKVEFGDTIVFDTFLYQDSALEGEYSRYICTLKKLVDLRFDKIVYWSAGTFPDNAYNPPPGEEEMGIEIWNGPTEKNNSVAQPGYFGHPRWTYIGGTHHNPTDAETNINNDMRQLFAPETDNFEFTVLNRNTGRRNVRVRMASLTINDTAAIAWVAGNLLQEDVEEYSVNYLENKDINAMLSIDDQDDPRIVIHDEDRFFGIIKSE